MASGKQRQINIVNKSEFYELRRANTNNRQVSRLLPLLMHLVSKYRPKQYEHLQFL
jgi:hypothetical protein